MSTTSYWKWKYYLLKFDTAIEHKSNWPEHLYEDGGELFNIVLSHQIADTHIKYFLMSEDERTALFLVKDLFNVYLKTFNDN